MNDKRLTKNINLLGYGFLHYFFSGLGQTFLISLFVPYFTKELGINNTVFGSIYSAATLTSGLIIPFAGTLLDRIRIRYASMINGGLLILFGCLTAFVSNFFLLYLALFGLRFCGQGIMVLIGSTAITRYFDYNRGKAISISSLGMPLSEAVLPVTVTALIALTSWQNTWFILASAVGLIFIPGGLGLVSRYHAFQKPVQNTEKSKSSGQARKEALTDFKFYALIITYGFAPFFFTGMFIHQNLLAEANGWSMTWLATCFTGYGIFRATTNLFAGPLIDRFSARKVFAFYLIPLSLGVGFLLFMDHKIAAFIYLSLGGMTTGMGSLTASSMWAEIYGVENLGTIKSMVSSFMIFSTAVAPIVIGWFLERGPEYLDILLYIFAALMVLLMIMANIIVRKINPANSSA